MTTLTITSGECYVLNDNDVSDDSMVKCISRETPMKAVTCSKIKETKAKILRKNVFGKIPKDYQMSHFYYIRNYIHGSSYFFLFFIFYYLQHKLYVYSNSHVDSSSMFIYIVVYLLTYVLSPFLMGWSWCALIGIGHDALHKGFAPQCSKIGQFLNWLMLKMTWDVLLSTTSPKDHMFHHKHTNTEEDTSMILLSLMNLGIVGEILHSILFSFRKFNSDDIKLLLFNSYNNRAVKINCFGKLWIIITLMNRFLWILGVYYHCDYDTTTGTSFTLVLRPLIGILNIIWGVFFVNMFAYAPHVSPAKAVTINDSEEDKEDMYLYQMRNAWELYPKNGNYEHFQQWIHTGTTMHVTHHCFTVIPRSFYSMVSSEIAKVYKNELRTINSLDEEINLLQTRTVFTSIDDITKHHKSA